MKNIVVDKFMLKIILFVVIAIIIFYTIIFSILYFTSYRRNNMMADDSLIYYNKIKDNIINTNQIDLNNIFTFDWEKAYIIKTQFFEPSELNEILNIECNISPMDDDTYLMILVFINNNSCVYELIYDYRFIEFIPLGEFIYSDNAIFEVTKENRPIKLEYINRYNKL